MTQSSAEKIANVVLGVAAVGAAYYIVKTPHLRQLAWRLTVVTMAGTLPAWIRQEIRAGWEASARTPDSAPALRGAARVG
jgi:hypothetical protein